MSQDFALPRPSKRNPRSIGNVRIAIAAIFLLLTNLFALQSFSPFLESSSRLNTVWMILVGTHTASFVTFRYVRKTAAQIASALLGLAGAVLIATRADPGQLPALLVTAFEEFQRSTPPAPVSDAFFAALVVLSAILGWLSTWIAVQMRTSLEAVLPSVAIAAMAATLGGDRVNLSAALQVAVCCALFLVAHRSWVDLTRHDWLPGTLLAEERRFFRRGIPVTAAVLGATTLLFAHVDWLTAPGYVDWREYRQQSPTSFMVDPLIDIGSQLRNRDGRTTLAFTAQISGDIPSSMTSGYWRLDGRTTYRDGQWVIPRPDDPNDQSLPERSPQNVGVTVTQIVTIAGLKAQTVPALYRPVSIDDTRSTIKSPTQTVTAPRQLRRGDTYTVRSTVLDIERETLTSARGSVLDPTERRLTTDDSQIIEPLREQAALLTSNAASDLERVELLQEWFRTEFAYDDTVDFDDGQQGLQQFVQSRRGFCQQFATAFALMSRSLGIPTRLAVGFTTGERVGRNTFEVYSNQVHVWPEVFFDGVGWVAFEPTPTRGSESIARYTAVIPQQAAPSAANPVATTSPTSTPLTTSTTSLAVPSSTLVPTTQPPITVTVDQADQPRTGQPNWQIGLGVIAVTSSAVVLSWSIKRRQKQRISYRDPWLLVESTIQPHLTLPESLTVVQRAEQIIAALYAAESQTNDVTNLATELRNLANEHSTVQFGPDTEATIDIQRYDTLAKRLVVVFASKPIA